MRERFKCFKMSRFTREIVLGHFFSSPTRVSDVLRRLQEVNIFFLMFLLVFIVLTVLIRLWFFLIPGIVFVNIQFELIFRDKLSSLRKLFLAVNLFFFFFFYKKVLCVCVYSCPCMCIYFGFFFVFSFITFWLINNL